MTRDPEIPSLTPLFTLARLYGVQTSYVDASGEIRPVSPETLLSVLIGLGADIQSLEHAPRALSDRRQQIWRRWIEPVIVSWEGDPTRVPLRLPVSISDQRLIVRLILESREQLSYEIESSNQTLVRRVSIEGEMFVRTFFELPGTIPLGYHQLTLEVGGKARHSLLIRAPLSAFIQPDGNERSIGAFMPIYSLHSDRSWGIGDFEDFAEFARWTGERGGSFAGTVPFLPTYLDRPFEPSPYSPVSRLFWNEVYVDPRDTPEMDRCPEAERLLGSSEFRSSLNRVRNSSEIDYEAVMKLKRRVLTELARVSSRTDESEPAAVPSETDVFDYACFRATMESQGRSWREWPDRLRSGTITPADYDLNVRDYYLYAQRIGEEQVANLSEKARRAGVGLYLDFPLGTHRDGYDPWRFREIFAEGFSVGAPPDPFFSGGQDWSFEPPHPEKAREQGYRYFRACLRHHLRHAGILRIDHIMGLQRLFWIPPGATATEGTYVRYRAEEALAILTLESHRHGAAIVGEDLGTVLPSIRKSMQDHRIHRSYVLQLEARENRSTSAGTVPKGSMASLNTHDLLPFAAWWDGAADAEAEEVATHSTREALLTFLRERGHLEQQAQDAESVLDACLQFLAESGAAFISVNLEDLWLETRRQNRPGTDGAQQSWRRRSHLSLEDLKASKAIAERFRTIANCEQTHPT